MPKSTTFTDVPPAGGDDHDVVGLEIAVHDAEVVRGLQCVGALGDDAGGAGQGHRAPSSSSSALRLCPSMNSIAR